MLCISTNSTYDTQILVYKAPVNHLDTSDHAMHNVTSTAQVIATASQETISVYPARAVV